MKTPCDIMIFMQNRKINSYTESGTRMFRGNSYSAFIVQIQKILNAPILRAYINNFTALTHNLIPINYFRSLIFRIY